MIRIHTKRAFLAIGLMTTMATVSLAHPRLETIRVDYRDQCTQLRHERDAALRQARHAYRATLEDFRCAEREARKLCEPERSCELARIREARRAAARDHRLTLNEIRRAYELAMRTARSQYVIACEQVTVDVLPCGCPVDSCGCNRQPAYDIRPIPAEPVSAVNPWQVLLPELFRVQTTRVIPVTHNQPRPVTVPVVTVPTATVPGRTCGTQNPYLKSRTVTRTREVTRTRNVGRSNLGRLLQAFATSL